MACAGMTVPFTFYRWSYRSGAGWR